MSLRRIAVLLGKEVRQGATNFMTVYVVVMPIPSCAAGTAIPAATAARIASGSLRRDSGLGTLMGEAGLGSDGECAPN